MADIIKIKRSTGNSAPSTLAVGELAHTEGTDIVYIGKTGGTIVPIGGYADHTKLAGIEAGAQVNTVTSVAGQTGAVTLDSGDITDFSTAVGTLIGGSDLEDLANVLVTTPADGQQLTWNATSSKWVNGAPGTGVTSFVQLNDVPGAYTASGGFFVKVNALATGLEFASAIDGGTY